MKIDRPTALQAVYALLDVLDGVQSYEIQEKTGLPAKRCAEIASLRSRLYTEYGADWLKLS